MKLHGNEQKNGTLKIQKSQIAILVLNQSPISAVCWGPKNSTIRGPPVFENVAQKNNKMLML